MSEFTVHTGALRTMADSCTAAARAVESVCADLPPAARTLADRLESDTAALRRLADAAEEIAALYEQAEQSAAADELRTLGAFAPARPGMEPRAPDPAPALTPMLGETVMARFRDA